MQSIYDFITIEGQNEHDLEYKTKFSSQKIFDGGGDLSKGWYVYFSYRNSKTGKLKRMKSIYGKSKRQKFANCIAANARAWFSCVGYD